MIQIFSSRLTSLLDLCTLLLVHTLIYRSFILNTVIFLLLVLFCYFFQDLKLI